MDKGKDYNSWNEGFNDGYRKGKFDTIFWGTILIVILVVVGFLLSAVASDKLSERYIEVNSKVVSVDVHKDQVSYATVSFENGKKYNINFPYDNSGKLDLDDGEHVLIHLRWSSPWINPNRNDCWGIDYIVKY